MVEAAALCDFLRIIIRRGELFIQMLDDKQRFRHAQRDELEASARRCVSVLNDELRSQIDVLSKRGETTKTEHQEIVERPAELNNANSTLQAAKTKTELDLQVLHVLRVVVSIALYLMLPSHIDSQMTKVKH